jgi:hypothetical protein
MGYSLTSIDQSQNIRLFAFECRGAAGVRTEFTVSVDISVIRAHAISLQELPLLCCQFLEEHAEAASTRELRFTETAMAEYALRREAAANKEGKPKKHRIALPDRDG